MNTHSTRDSADEWRPSVNPWLVAMAVMLATFLEVLDTTIVSVAQPNMVGSLGATTEEAAWVLTSYLVANAIVLPASGWFSLRFGRKRFLLACTGLFTLGSFLCGIAPTMPLLIVALASCRARGVAHCCRCLRRFFWRAFRARSREWRWRCSAWGLWAHRSWARL